MFNVTVIRLKDIVKYIAIALAIYFFWKFIINCSFEKVDIKNIIKIDTNEVLTLGIESESTIFNNIDCLAKDDNNEKIKPKEKDISKEIFQIGSNAFRIIDTEVKKEDEIASSTDSKNVNQEETAELEKEIPISDAKNEVIEASTTKIITDVSTQVVTKNPIKESYNREYNGIKIKNETDFELTDSILNSDDLNINKKNILIFHTHTCESYTQSENFFYEETRKF